VNTVRNKFFLASAFLVTTICVGAQVDLTGYWLFKVPIGDGTFRESFLDLKQSGDQISGRVLNGKRETPITEGSLKDGKLHIVATANSQGRTRQYVYDGTIENGKLALALQAPGRDPVQGVGERSSPEAAQPPPRLPTPGLHDLPDKGLAKTPPMGWNSWNKFAGKVTDEDVRGMADAIVSSGMSKAGYIYVNIDDTWQGSRDAKGNITTNKKFPDMKGLADYVHSKGLKIGLYSSPGPKTCAGYEGTYGHEDQDAKQWAAWGFDYIKYDWCSAGDIYKDEDMRAVYQKMGDALAKTGRPILFSLCQYGKADVWKWGSKVGGNAWRTTGDISDNWQSMEKIGFSQFDIAPYIRPGHWNDPDMLEIGNGGMTNDEYKTHMTLWSMLAAPLLAGNDVRTMSDETKAILMNTEVIAIDQDRAAKPAKKVLENGATDVVVRPLADGSVAVALFNRGAEAAEISVPWSSTGVSGKNLEVRDLWLHQPVQISGDQYSTTVPSHGVVLLKVKTK
jgi:alpha-galactosidase